MFIIGVKQEELEFYVEEIYIPFHVHLILFQILSMCLVMNRVGLKSHVQVKISPFYFVASIEMCNLFSKEMETISQQHSIYNHSSKNYNLLVKSQIILSLQEIGMHIILLGLIQTLMILVKQFLISSFLMIFIS